ncbi:beta-glucosidase BglX [Butyrivibrio sp. LC3010]|uniref:beta-glucosidase BglX n=1 Tax=Butyrivibrio sp. LC3010 TaxID=1280680 RepID=UPI000418CF4D|nr:beta-glucosidase BglX [Butyrivibrio sp. LC3010]
MTRENLEALLKDMSLEEKIMQLVQVPGWTFEKNAAVTGIADNPATEKATRLAGSTLGVYGADKVKAIQDEYIKNHPHHIPMLFMLDVIHGHDTVFPCPLAQGATFEPDVSRKGAEVQAKEAAADGIHVTFSPMVDLVRDARWGRVVESTGEDAYLNGEMASAMVKGYQGDSIADKDHVAACVKHFAAYGAAEAGRDYNNCELSEYALRDQYLKGYNKAIDAGARLVMTSFNTLNGIPSSGNKWLMRDILRKEMGFDGVLISDWGAISEMTSWGIAEDLKEAAKLAMEAGVDIDMCTESYGANLEELIAKGDIDVKLLDEAVLRVLDLKNDLGLFEDPYHGASKEKHDEIAYSAESREIARDAVRKSLVLLENREEALPIKEKKVALIGPYAVEKNLQSSWALATDPEKNVTLMEAAGEDENVRLYLGLNQDKDIADGQKTVVRVAKGSTLLDNDTVLGVNTYHNDNFEEENERLYNEAMEVAQWADTVILCLGEDFGQSGESTSRAEILLPDIQMELFYGIRKNAKKLVTLVFTGRPLDLEHIPDLSDATMICWRPGTEGGHGIWDVLSGKFSPSGKLPMSFPWSVGQEPIYYNSFVTGRPKPEEGPSNFTTRYLDCPNEARYPFGYGLTYAEFEISDVELDKTTLKKNSGVNEKDKIIASVRIANTGLVPATQTMQLYIRDLAGSRVRPVMELKGFKKVRLLPGEEKQVCFEICEEMLRFWTIENKTDSECGKFKVYIGVDSATENEAEFVLE